MDRRGSDGLVIVRKEVIVAVAIGARLEAPRVEHAVDVDQKERMRARHVTMTTVSGRARMSWCSNASTSRLISGHAVTSRHTGVEPVKETSNGRRSR
jgi:hypothetical protein